MTRCYVGLLHYEIKKRYFLDNRTHGTVNWNACVYAEWPHQPPTHIIIPPTMSDKAQSVVSSWHFRSWSSILLYSPKFLCRVYKETVTWLLVSPMNPVHSLHTVLCTNIFVSSSNLRLGVSGIPPYLMPASCFAHLALFDWRALIIFCETYKLWNLL